MPASFTDSLNEKFTEMLANYTGGLSNTSVSKFDGIRELFCSHLDINGEDAVYAIGAGTRPGNIEVRLSQGTRAFKHTTLGLAFVKTDDQSKVETLSNSSVTTITGFLDRGKANYDSILVLVEFQGQPIPTRLVTYSDSPVRTALNSTFQAQEGFSEILLERPPASEAAPQVLQSVAEDREKWKIPDAPKNLEFSWHTQRLIEGCPGSGKSFNLHEESLSADRIVRTVFHPETGFSDFVGFLAPETAFKLETPAPIFDKDLPGIPHVFYSFCFGPLLEAYLYAVMNPDHNIVLIIEELSRAPASLVFGDTLQLLDRVNTGEISPSLPPPGFSRYEIRPKGEIKSLLEKLEAFPSHTQEGCMRFPPNLYIWATMNRADQNARQLDTAFLRRWKRTHISHNTPGIHDSEKLDYNKGSITWGDFRTIVNSLLIASGAREDKLIGPYFLPKESISSPEIVADDLLAYIWYDVLRESGGEIFPSIFTFSELREKWISGKIVIGENDGAE